MEQYNHEPLRQNQIRLFSLLPGLPGEALRCKLRNVELPRAKESHRAIQTPIKSTLSDRVPLYEAISYVWGPQEPQRFLHVEGQTGGTLVIGPNLHDALKRLRPSPNQGARNLWADQICIDQDNLEERSIQVQRMKDVYKTAQKVLIWLGSEDEHTALGFDFLKRLHELTDNGPEWFSEETDRKLSLEFSDRLPSKYMEYEASPSEPHVESPESDVRLRCWCLAAINKISYRSWFERTWTFQEVTLARDAVLICGDCSIPWKVFAFHITHPKALLHTLYGEDKVAFELAKFPCPPDLARSFGVSGMYSFTSLLASRRNSICQDPRDKVIALLGVLDDLFDGCAANPIHRNLRCPSDFIRPSYKEPAELIFAKTAQYLLQTSRTLEILWHIDPTSVGSNMPSWVPDWSPLRFDILNFRNTRPVATLKSPYPTWLCNAVGDEGRQVLEVAAVRQDTIKNLKGCNEHSFTSFFQQSTSSGIYPLTTQPIQIAATQMMVSGQWSHTYQATRAALLGLGPSIKHSEHPQTDGSPLEDQIAPLEQIFKKGHPDSQVFCGKDGTIGYGPKSLQTGDEVHLLLGLDVPVALRPTIGGYRFTGVCYVHGLMYGEGLCPGREPQSCYYPGSSTVDITEKQHGKYKERRWEMFETRSETLEWFESRSSYHWDNGWLQDPSWSPEVVTFGEKSIWLMEKGSNPVPIITEELTLV